VAAGVAVLAAAAVPWSDGPLRRLAEDDGAGPHPRLDVQLDIDHLQGFGETHSGGTYFLDASRATPLEQGNAKAAAQLYNARMLPVLDRAEADYIVRLVGKRFTTERRR
jgi:hypothetical protein